jgi:hypothetical protein
VKVIASHRQTLFGPTITVHLKDGRSFSKEGTGREFIWDFEEEAKRIRGVLPNLSISAEQFDRLTDSCRRIESLDNAARLLIDLTAIPALEMN